tara:strand:+ start:1485 stop:2381 length:897 start_codon:yes stop_codon:yes gene_type:complete
MKGAKLYIDMFKVFSDVAETGSFSKAAEINYISQSAVSQQISSLERYYGRHLILRGRGRFALTREGKIFLLGCKKILLTNQTLIDQIQAEQSELIQTINFESIYSIGFYHLPPHIKSFMKTHKKINLHLEYNRSDRIYTNVIHGICDFGVVAAPWNHPMIEIDLGKKEALIFACAPSHKLAKKKEINLSDLNNQNFIGFIKEIPTRRIIDNILKNHNINVNIIHEFDNVETMKQFLELGDGVTLIPKKTIQKELKEKSLVTTKIKEESFYREIGIITKKDRALSLAAQEVIKHLLISI